MWLPVFVRLSPHASSCQLASFSFCLCFILPFFALDFVWFVCFFLSFWGSQSWGCLSCLFVTGRYTPQSLWLTALIDVSWFTGHENNIFAPKWTLHLTLSVSFLFTTTTFCAGRASQNWIYGYGTLLFILLCLKGLPRSYHSHTLLSHLLSKTNNWVSLNLSLFFSCPLTCFWDTSPPSSACTPPTVWQV